MASTLSSTIVNSVTLGSGNYSSPLTITSTGAITAPTASTALTIAVAGSVLNDGVIVGGAGTTGGTGAYGVVITQGTLTNAGTIKGGAGSTGGQAVRQSGGTVTNTGTIISGAGSAGEAGFALYMNGGTFINDGVILTGAASSRTGIAVRVDGGVFIDDGQVLGGADGAGYIVTYGANDPTVEFESGATLSNKVFAHGSSSTLGVTGATPFTLTSVGNLVEAFNAFTFASTLSGFGMSGTEFYGRPISGFIAGDNITITNFAATSESFAAANELVLKNSSGGTETLDLEGFVSTGALSISSNGSATTITSKLVETISTSISPGITLGTGDYGDVLFVTSTGGVGGAGGAGGAAGNNYSAGGAGSGGGDGIVTADGTLTNAGTIEGGTGGVGGASWYGDGGTGGAGGDGINATGDNVLTNAGAIAGGAGGAGGEGDQGTGDTDAPGGAGGAGGDGIYATGDNVLTNEGTIAGGVGGSGGAESDAYGGTGGVGGDGIVATGGTLTNDDTIEGGTGGAGGVAATYKFGNSGAGGDGISATGITLTNDGAIAGGVGGDGVAGSELTGNGGAGGDGINATGDNVLANDGTIAGGVGGAGGKSGGYSGAGGAGGDGINATGGTLTLTSNSNSTIEGGAGGDGGDSTGYNGNDVTIYGGGGAGGDGIATADGTLTNEGIIAGGTGGTGGSTDQSYGGNGGAGGDGINATGDNVLTNDGTIAGGAGGAGGSAEFFYGGNGGDGGDGIYATGDNVLTNDGTIIGGAGGALGSNGNGTNGAGGVGVYLDGGTLTSAGLIEGGSGADAVQFGSAASTLVVAQGASFIGAVAAYAGGADVLQFTNGASLNLGSTFTNFAVTDILAAANVTLSGTLESAVVNNGTIDTANGTSLVITGALTGTGLIIDDPATIVLDGSVSSSQTVSLAGTGDIVELGDATQFDGTITGFAGSDAIILEGFTATSENWSANALTLANASGTAALSISASADDFAVLDDGTNSTIFAAPSAISFTGSAETLSGHEAGFTAASISDFSTGDAIIIEGFAATSEALLNGSTLVLSNGVSSVDLNISGISDYLALTTDGANSTIIATAFLHTISTAIAGDLTLDAITSPYGGPLTITGSGTVTGNGGVSYAGDNNLYASGFSGGAGGAAITGGTADTITNEGDITGGAGGAGENSTYYTAGSGASGGDGLVTTGGSLTNDGTIAGGDGGAGGDSGGDYSGGAGNGGGSGIATTDGTLTNDGTIAGGAGGGGGTVAENYTGGTGGAGGDGINASGDNVLTNDSTIIGGAGGAGGSAEVYPATGGAGGDGINATGDNVLTNDGTIIGGAGGAGGTETEYYHVAGSGAGGVGVYLDGGTLTNAGLIEGGSGAYAVQFGATAGTLIVAQGASFIGAVAAYAGGADVLQFTNGASLNLGNSFTNFAVTEILANTLVTLGGTLSSAVQNDGTIDTADGTSLVITGALTGTGVIIDDPSTIVLDGSVASGQTISLTGTGNTLELGDAAQFNGTITGFTTSDTLVIDNFTETSASYADGTLVLDGNDGGTVTSLTIALDSAFTTADFVFSSDGAGGTDIVVCYLRGTMILTPSGEVPIESLQRGDLVATRFGGMQAIKWIGRQSFLHRFVRHSREHMPVRIATGALGRGLPLRPLYVSGGHSMLLDGQLVLARNLINGVNITRHDAPEEIHYYQLEFQAHDCVLAEGAWSESYADAEGLRNQFHNAASFHDLYPDYVAPPEPVLCAPRYLEGPLLDAALCPILALARAEDPAEGELRGWVDDVHGDRIIAGWAQDVDQPEFPVLLEILFKGERLGTVLACAYRGDLMEAGIGPGQHAFNFTSPVPIGPEDIGHVSVRRLSDGTKLQHSVAYRERMDGSSPAKAA
jgi:hypothetical protein